jgi:alanyl-tRNA synthetase
VTCTEAQLKTITNGKKSTLNGYEVVLEDTILFPEGGGQVYLIYFIYLYHSSVFIIPSFKCSMTTFNLFNRVYAHIQHK